MKIENIKNHSKDNWDKSEIKVTAKDGEYVVIAAIREGLAIHQNVESKGELNDKLYTVSHKSGFSLRHSFESQQEALVFANILINDFGIDWDLSKEEVATATNGQAVYMVGAIHEAGQLMADVIFISEL